MKAGDFLTEIINRKDITTASDITKYRTQRSISYLRDGNGQLTPIGKKIVEELQVYAEKVRKENAERAKKKMARENAQLIQLQDHSRKTKLIMETMDLLMDELNNGQITQQEYDELVRKTQGYE
jgi:hypothetical protein